MQIRKTMLFRDRTETDEMGAPCDPLTRAAALAVLRNPFAGVDQDDLTELFEYGAMLGAQLAAEAVAALGAPPVSYGKAAIVGAHGAAEHGAALLHPRLGKPVRAAIGGGRALMPSNVKMGVVGAVIDVPLGHKDEPWSFDHIDTLSIAVPDAPLPNEIVVCVGMSDGARIRARVGKGPS
ncbi:amino acid synthesis family protein [Limibaculum sp. FT325]|uniref:amino acid synthesis family protein n=1 Tax=Thermohalobaculum sediminis TaxID=2939436 RepID=UPI0020BFB049|nr:amino acid synthesis family protein [Limibaculum sediminis]MCL5776359.1 amino acid synthesis family protein [Limibaculum sediminis]